MTSIKDLEIGDEVVVEYTTGRTMKGGRLTGKITKLWKGEDTPGCTNLWQAQVNNGWCFHDEDAIIQFERQEKVA